MSGYTSILDATPGFVAGTFDAKDVRLGMFFNGRPGLFAAGDFAASQRAAGANMSLDIAQGRVLVDPGYTHGGLYLARRTDSSAYNTLASGGYTWTAADPTNPRIDIVCIEAADTDEGGSYTGFKIRVIDGTPNAGATHQLEAQYWPTIPATCTPITAVRVPAAATTLTTANITNLNPIGGMGRSAVSYTAAAETTTSAAYARLATPDFAMVFVPSSARVRVGYKGQWKISSASGNQGVSLFLNGVQVKLGAAGTVPALADGALGTIAGTANTYRHLSTIASSGVGFQTDVSGAADVSDVATGQILGIAGAPGSPIEIFGLPSGWYAVETRYKTSANTLTVRERRMIAEVIG